MKEVVISGSGLWRPENVVTNEELVSSYNAYADLFNSENQAAIERGAVQAKAYSSSAFIEKASGIKQRFIYEKEGVLDIHRMRPKITPRSEDALSDQAEMAVMAAKDAMERAQKTPEDIDAIIVAFSYTQRAFPAIAIEVQEVLGIEGFGFDMLVACSAAAFGLQRAYEMVVSGTGKCVLVINPELYSPQVNYKERDSHFIFGDVSVATIVESRETCKVDHPFKILSTKAYSKYSNNIRTNFGFVGNSTDVDSLADSQLFHQKGRAVFKEVCPMAAKHMKTHLAEASIPTSKLKRLWLHQANGNMNRLISSMVLDRQPECHEAPTVLDEFGNTGAAGSIVTFHKYHEDLQAGDIGIICAFGAGYTIGSILIQRV